MQLKKLFNSEVAQKQRCPLLYLVDSAGAQCGQIQMFPGDAVRERRTIRFMSGEVLRFVYCLVHQRLRRYMPAFVMLWSW